MILIFVLASIMVLIAIFAYAKYNANKSQETGSGASIEKKRENTRRIEETGYSERDEREYEGEDSDDSDNDE